ncbi:hypothetical protein ABEF95_008075 [Exophiala dermatitidis]
MPKKYQQRALLTKPQSSTPHTLSLSKSSGTRAHNAAAQPSVNDLIRESRRLQLRNDSRPPPVTNASSIPPAVREVLDLPAPPPPAPRVGTRPTGPSRLRRIPGPPPPRSWLTDSIHAPKSVSSSDADGNNRRIQVRTSNLPDGVFPPDGSLQHMILKKIATNWAWHAEHDYDYLGLLPTTLKETLLSYLAVYNDVPIDPLQPLFLDEIEQDDRDEVHRLDLSNGIGTWTTFRQLEKDLFQKTAAPTPTKSRVESPNALSLPIPDSWDATDDNEEVASMGLSPGPRITPNFKNLNHLSLAISPTNAKAASWTSLLLLATELRTLTSLSLANWPQPTFTPNAASTRTVVRTPGAPPVVYSGSDMYTSYDNNWREAAGILRTLSRSLYCLKWLDLTGCGDWFGALQWRGSSIESSSLGPEWNAGWRGLETLILQVGWKPVPPTMDDLPTEPDQPSWNVENERKLYRYSKERERFAEIRSTAQSVARYLRSVRKDAGGKWIHVDCGEELATEGYMLHS